MRTKFYLSIAFLYLFIWILFWLLSHYSPVGFGDDLGIRFIFGEENHLIESLSDCFRSAYNHYFIQHGRLPIAFLAITFDSIIGKEIFDICNASIFSVVIFLISRYSSNTNLFFKTIVTLFFFFFFIPAFQETNLWIVGSVNYLWVSLIILIFLLIFRHYSQSPYSCRLVWICPFTIIAGMCHEAFSLPISFGLLVYILRNRNYILRSSALPIAISFMVGTGLLVFAPGNFHRSGLGNGFDIKLVLSHLAAGLYSLFFSLRIFWLFVFLFIYKYWNDNYGARSFFVQHLMEGSALLISPLILFTFPMYGGRITYSIEILSLILFICLISKFNVLKTKYISLTLCGIILMVYIPVVTYAYTNHLNAIYVQEQLKAKERVVKVPLVDGNDWIISRYLLYISGFGPSCYYFSLSPKDSNMQKASLLYNIPDLVLLPEDIYLFIEEHQSNDLSSFYITRKDWPYYVKQVKDESQITKVELVLRDIDFSSLPLYIRPIAPRLERYNTTTVPVRNSVIKILNHYYLFVEKSVPEVNDRVIGIKVEY